MSESNITAIQDDIYQRILNDTWLASVSVINERKGEILTEITNALGVLNERSGKAGACIIVLAPSASVEYPEAVASSLDVRIAIRVLEDPLFNLDATKGTQKDALAICKRLVMLLHLYTAYGIANPLLPESPTIVPVEDPLAPKAFEVRFHAVETDVDSYSKTATPWISPNGGAVPATVTLTCQTSGAQIRYTTDGTTPTSNSALYNAPLSITQPTKLRACAFKAGEIASDVSMAVFA